MLVASITAKNCKAIELRNRVVEIVEKQKGNEKSKKNKEKSKTNKR
jgi:hypothetical protein